MVSRRRFVLGTLAGAGALILGWGLMPPRQRLVGSVPLPLAAGQSGLNGWVKISADDSVTVMIAKSEMGQGVTTALAMLLADELDARWDQVRVESSPIDSIYNNIATVVDGLPFHPDDHGPVRSTIEWLTAKSMREFGLMVTGGSSSIKDLWLPMREAGASARAMLAAAAAQRWQVAPGECQVAEGRVTHPSGKSARFGELAAQAATGALPERVPLKRLDQFRLIGQPVRRIDARAKLVGEARFGIDMALPGMLHARVLMCPTLGGAVAGFDAAPALAMPGVRKAVAVQGYHGGTAGVAVIADQPFQAMQALAKVAVQWQHGPAAKFSSERFERELTATLEREEGHAYYTQGDATAALASAARTISATYSAPYLAHAALEPMNCTVLVEDARATVWASTQVPGMARRAAAKALDMDSSQVDVRVQFLGGGFGRRLDVDFVGQAAAIAAHARGTPVQTIWSREQDMTHDFYRPACVSKFVAGLDPQGRLLAWHNTSASQAIIPQVLGRYFGLPAAGPDKTTAEGAFDQPYEWPAARIAHQAVDAPIPVGPWRSVGHSHQAFFKESFIDEVAHAAGQDPVAFRAALLTRHPRHLVVLRQAAERAGWGQALPAAPDGAPKARGIALHQSFGAIVAQVAEVSLDAQRRIRVHKVTCVIDCGFVVNPNLVRQQIEGGIVFGLSAALYGGVTIVDGQVRQSNFHDQPVLRIDECPVIDTYLVASDRAPEGVGEPGTAPIAPALGNALFALTGQRLRSLPFKLA
ncbi:MAG: xanthine dehydrogenase family protein molybdopterin-binding subunit [Burkholderiaceae bacterium]|nr:xanthine dehydrogenase family protein molybdopterin-binding subunit [Burkholderiaceae bacterium]